MSTASSAFGVVNIVPASANARSREVINIIRSYLLMENDNICREFRALGETGRVRALMTIANMVVKYEGILTREGDTRTQAELLFKEYKDYIPGWIKKAGMPSRPGAPPMHPSARAMPSARSSGGSARSSGPKRQVEKDIRQSLLRGQLGRAHDFNGAMPEGIRATSRT